MPTLVANPSYSCPRQGTTIWEKRHWECQKSSFQKQWKSLGNCGPNRRFRASEINQKLTTIWRDFLKWLNIGNNRLLTPFIFPGLHLSLFHSVAALKSACNCGDSQQPSSCRTGQKRVGALSRPLSQRIVIIWPILQFLRNPSRKTCLYLPWLRAHPCEKPSPQGHLSKPIRSNCLIAQLPEAAAKAGTNIKLSTKREWKKHE